jgi:hypothetical protein
MQAAYGAGLRRGADSRRYTYHFPSTLLAEWSQPIVNPNKPWLPEFRMKIGSANTMPVVLKYRKQLVGGQRSEPYSALTTISARHQPE